MVLLVTNYANLVAQKKSDDVKHLVETLSHENYGENALIKVAESYDYRP